MANSHISSVESHGPKTGSPVAVGHGRTRNTRGRFRGYSGTMEATLGNDLALEAAIGEEGEEVLRIDDSWLDEIERGCWMHDSLQGAVGSSVLEGGTLWGDADLGDAASERMHWEATEMLPGRSGSPLGGSSGGGE